MPSAWKRAGQKAAYLAEMWVDRRAASWVAGMAVMMADQSVVYSVVQRAASLVAGTAGSTAVQSADGWVGY